MYTSENEFVQFYILAHKAIREKWARLRYELMNESFSPDDVGSAKKSKFLSELDKLFVQENGKRFFEKSLIEISQQNYFVRGCIIPQSDPMPTHERFIPKAQYIKDDNRFSPKGVEWLYLSLGTPKNKTGLKNAITCAQKECRVKPGDRFAYCEFISNSSKPVVIDLTIDEGWTPDSQRIIYRNLIKTYERLGYDHSHHSTCTLASLLENECEKSVTKLYCQILSSELFVPLKMDKHKSHIPFHCIAYYFQSLGYSGIIYRSTVYDSGKNLVLFNKMLSKPTGPIKKIYII